MPLIRGRYYANPAYGKAMERGRGHEAEPESAREDEREPTAGPDSVGAGSEHGGVHQIHIEPHAEGVRVQVQYYGPASDAEHDAPSGQPTPPKSFVGSKADWCTHNFDSDDHEGIGRFVASALAHRTADKDR